MSVSQGYRAKVTELNNFQKKHKRLPKRGEPLGHWCSQQKYLFKKGLLSKEKAALLKKSGLLISGEYNVLSRASEVQRFYESHGRFPFRDETTPVGSIGEWWYKLQVQIEQYMISDVMREQIETCYPTLFQSAVNRKNKKFYEWIQLLSQYQLETGRIEPKNREKYMGRWLGDWCTRQRLMAKRGQLSDEKIQILSKMKVLPEHLLETKNEE